MSPDPPEVVPHERYWVIAESELHAALLRVADGDDPGIVLLELEANSTGETP